MPYRRLRRVFLLIGVALLLPTGCFLSGDPNPPPSVDGALPDCERTLPIMEEGFATIRVICARSLSGPEPGRKHELEALALGDQGQVLLKNALSDPHPKGGRTINYRALLYLDGTLQNFGEASLTDVNRDGDLVGYLHNKNIHVAGNWSAALWQGAARIDLPRLVRDGWSEAHSINDLGQIVGQAADIPSAIRLTPGPARMLPVLWEHRDGRWQVTRLEGLPEDYISGGLTINNSEQIITNSLIGGYWPVRAFPWEQGAVTDLGTLGGAAAEALDINDQGQIVGWSETGTNVEFPPGTTTEPYPVNRAFLWENGVMSDIGTLGGQTSEAVAINERGEIVGKAATAEFEILEFGMETDAFQITRPFLHRDGDTVDLNDLVPPGSDLRIIEAIDINDAGEILCNARYEESSEYVIVVMTPPEQIGTSPE